MRYTAEQLENLENGRLDVIRLAGDLKSNLVSRNYRTEKAQEHATHGLGRRIGTLARCVDSVFRLLPPANTHVPRNEVVDDATINIQAFVFNAFGCCDNIAWMWVLERDVRDTDGSELKKEQIGLGSKYTKFRASCPHEFRDYLATREQWFSHLKDFRDALAHRIPLYIPPFTIEPIHEEEYRKLMSEKFEAACRADLSLRDEIIRRQQELERFSPIMTHSFSESMPVYFHAQLVVNFMTIDELLRRMLFELDKL